jgi:hypothetical protein
LQGFEGRVFLPDIPIIWPAGLENRAQSHPDNAELKSTKTDDSFAFERIIR